MDPLTDIDPAPAVLRPSTRIDLDFEEGALKDFILHETGWQTIARLLTDLQRSGGVAATWTGPYGTGKSTLALFLASLLSDNETMRSAARSKLGARQGQTVEAALAATSTDWLSVRLVGQRHDLAATVFDALRDAALGRWPGAKWLIDALENRDPAGLMDAVGKTLSNEGAGLLLIVDEMGKFLEAAADQTGDLMVLQDLAERAVRGACPTILLGILHQAFDEYARRLGGLAREEWAKIQGRFSDTPFSLSVDETVSLIGLSLQGRATKLMRARASTVLEALDTSKLSSSKAFEKRLSRVAPLDPMTALMLGPISRRRFSQNERSIFSFLGSGEPFGLKDYLKANDAAYPVDMLWDYLHHNFHSAILASGSDGRLWGEAADAVLRAERLDDALCVRITKTVVLIEMFARPFGLVATDAVISAALADVNPQDVDAALKRLSDQSVIVHRKHLGGWCIYGGSDIDLDIELERGLSAIGDRRDAALTALPTLRPVVAKRHYHETGAMRWFERVVTTPARAIKQISARLKKSSASGFFVLILEDEDGVPNDPLSSLKKLASDDGRPLLVAQSEADEYIEVGSEYAALQWVQSNTPELASDRIARAELSARRDAVEQKLYDSIEASFADAAWVDPIAEKKKARRWGLTQLASEAAGRAYSSAPVIFNELINRNAVSGNVAGARRKLMYAMVRSRRNRDLGIEGYPPEKSIYLSLLLQTGMHGETTKPGRYDFLPPKDDAWRAVIDEADRCLREEGASLKSADALYNIWAAPPFGLKRALLPIVLLHYASLRENCVAFYQNGYYAPDIGADQIDTLLQQPEKTELKWIAADGINRDLLIRVARFVDEYLDAGPVETALEVTKPLAQFAYRLPPVVKRTASLSERTRKLRDVLVNASDPFELLFKDLPQSLGLVEASEHAERSRIAEIVQRLSEAVTELINAEENILDQLRDAVFKALETERGEGYEALIERAVPVPMETGDEQLNGFIARLRNASASASWAQAIGTLAAGKPYKTWSDADVAAAKLRIAELGRRFAHVEAFLAARSTSSESLTYALTVEGGGGDARTTLAEATRVRREDAPLIEKAASDLLALLDGEGLSRSQVRAVLVKALCVEHSQPGKGSVTLLSAERKLPSRRKKQVVP